jgi:predicted transporter
MFIPADIICLVLQATGGALSATGATVADVNVGVNISKAGLILQVVVLVVFLSLATDYLVALRRKTPHTLSRMMQTFLGFMFLAVILILVRCIYRIVELKDGYFGPNFRDEPEFIGLEGGYVYLDLDCECLQANIE